MSKKRTFKAKINARRIKDGIVNPGKISFLGILLQLLENGFDARRTDRPLKLHIRIVDRGKDNGFILLTDNGKGFSEEDFDAFVDVHNEHKQERRDTIGQHGTGSKHAFGVCKRIVVFTASEDYPKCVRMVYDDNIFLASIDKGDEPDVSIEDVARKPKWVTIDGTGSVIRLDKIVDWKKIPSSKYIIANLAKRMNPSIARCVRVNNIKLAERDVLFGGIEETMEVDYLAGQQQVEIVFPEKPGHLDRISVGGYNKICSLMEVYETLPRLEEKELFPRELLAQNMCGTIFVPDLNYFRSTSSDCLVSRFYEVEGKGLRMNFIRFLREKVLPLVEMAQKKVAVKTSEKAKEQLLENLCSHINPAWDFDPSVVRGIDDDLGFGPGGVDTSDKNPKDRKEPTLRVSPTTVTLRPGEKETFKIVSTKGTSGRFCWEDSNSGGQLNRKMGRSVTFIAGNQCSKKAFKLTVADIKDPTICRTLYINIVRQVIPIVSPQGVDIPRGASHEFRIRNINATSGNISWRLKGNSPHIRLMRSKARSTTVVVGKGAPLSTETLIAHDLKTDKDYVANFDVIRAMKTNEGWVKIEEKYYFIQISESSTSAVARIRDGKKVTKKGGKVMLFDVLRVGMGHPILIGLDLLLKGTKGKAATLAFVMEVFNYMVVAHIRGLIEDGTSMHGVEFANRMVEIKKDYIERRSLTEQ